MNPTSSETGGMQLPPPVMEQPLAAANPAEQALITPERPVQGSEAAPAAQRPPQTALPTIALPLPPSAPQAPAPSQPAASAQVASTSAISDDDLIEKEWVNKAKQIVALNRDDPYKQSEELTVFRADYMKKHYDKNIKLSD